MGHHRFIIHLAEEGVRNLTGESSQIVGFWTDNFPVYFYPGKYSILKKQNLIALGKRQNQYE